MAVFGPIRDFRGRSQSYFDPDLQQCPLVQQWREYFLIALLFSVQLLHLLSAIALGDIEERQVWRSVVVMTVLVLLMVGTRLRLNGQAESVTLTPRRSITPAAAPCVKLRLRFNRGTRTMPMENPDEVG